MTLRRPSAGDGVDPGVAVDDVRVRPDVGLEPGDPVAVDDDVLVAAEAGNRPAHREVGSVVDVQPVDLGDGRRPDTDRDPPVSGSAGRAARAAREGSSSRGRRGSGGSPIMITAAATTAPHVGATPTSSTPATRVRPSFHRRRSWRRVGTMTVIGLAGSRSPAIRLPPMESNDPAGRGRAADAGSAARSGAPGASRPCRRACGGSTAGPGGPGRGG